MDMLGSFPPHAETVFGDEFASALCVLQRVNVLKALPNLNFVSTFKRATESFGLAQEHLDMTETLDTIENQAITLQNLREIQDVLQNSIIERKIQVREERNPVTSAVCAHLAVIL
jgi:hypothetical protein